MEAAINLSVTMDTFINTYFRIHSSLPNVYTKCTIFIQKVLSMETMYIFDDINCRIECETDDYDKCI